VYTFSTNSVTGMQTIALYIDGALAVTGTNTVHLPSSAGGGYLGRSFNPQDAYLNGAIDEFRVWKTALSAAQVAQNFQSGPDAIVIVSDPSIATPLTTAPLPIRLLVWTPRCSPAPPSRMARSCCPRLCPATCSCPAAFWAPPRASRSRRG
jgi:hypothetical protein